MLKRKMEQDTICCKLLAHIHNLHCEIRIARESRRKCKSIFIDTNADHLLHEQ